MKILLALFLFGVAIQPRAGAQVMTDGTGTGVISLGTVMGQTSSSVGQPALGIGQTTIGIGQTVTTIGQPTTGIGQTTIGIGQPTIGIGQTTIGIGQTTIGIGLPMLPVAQGATNTAITNVTVTAAPTNAAVTGGFDGQFLRRAIADSQLEILLGQVAETNASTAGVQNFGAALVADHTAALAQAQALAASLGISAPNLATSQQRFVNSFGRLTPTQLDTRFINFAIQSQISDINFFENAALRSRNADVRTFARAQLPVLMQHLVMALELRDTL
jgi:putative membrane protein